MTPEKLAQEQSKGGCQQGGEVSPGDSAVPTRVTGIPLGCCVGWVAVTNALHVFLQAWPDLLLQGILGEILLHAEAAENSPLL